MVLQGSSKQEDFAAFHYQICYYTFPTILSWHQVRLLSIGGAPIYLMFQIDLMAIVGLQSEWNFLGCDGCWRGKRRLSFPGR
jgi:hypothetical protein